MYEQREEVITFLRVHPIPGIMDYINFEVKHSHNCVGVYIEKNKLLSQFFKTGRCTYEILQLSQ